MERGCDRDGVVGRLAEGDEEVGSVGREGEEGYAAEEDGDYAVLERIRFGFWRGLGLFWCTWSGDD